MAISTFTVPNISCNHCLHTIKTELGELDGVLKVDADLDTKVVNIEFVAPAEEKMIVELLKEINYPPEL